MLNGTRNMDAENSQSECSASEMPWLRRARRIVSSRPTLPLYTPLRFGRMMVSLYEAPARYMVRRSRPGKRTQQWIQEDPRNTQRPRQRWKSRTSWCKRCLQLRSGCQTTPSCSHRTLILQSDQHVGSAKVFGRDRKHTRVKDRGVSESTKSAECNIQHAILSWAVFESHLLDECLARVNNLPRFSIDRSRLRWVFSCSCLYWFLAHISGVLLKRNIDRLCRQSDNALNCLCRSIVVGFFHEQEAVDQGHGSPDGTPILKHPGHN